MKKWGELIAVTLLNLLQGQSLHQSITAGASQSVLDLDAQILHNLTDYPDSIVVANSWQQTLAGKHIVQKIGKN